MNDENDLNKYVYNYLNNNKTNTAILLNGNWGSGKTFYVKNSLMPFLKNNGKNFVYVFLYGIKSVEELSKYIFTESRFKPLNSKAGLMTEGIAKTVIRGVTGYFNIDLNGGVQEWNKLKKYANLKDKLLILDDIERHDPSLDIIEIMGYINNLCEQDTVKVLLVCDENILLENQVSENITQNYKRIKEKTIGDTIQFIPSIYDVLSSIINSFSFPFFKGETNNINVEIIKAINNENNLPWNFRAIIRGFQKMYDYYQMLGDSTKDYCNEAEYVEFSKRILLSLVIYYLRLSTNANLKCDVKEGASICLGNGKFPLYKFLYDFCSYQFFDLSSFTAAYNTFKKEKEIEKANGYISIIKSFYTVTENELSKALNSFKISIEGEFIDPACFVGMTTYLVAIKFWIKLDVQPILDAMIIYFNNHPDFKITNEYLNIYSGYSLESTEEIDDFKKFIEQLKSIKSSKKQEKFNSKISKDNIQQIIKSAEKNFNEWLITKEGFSTFINFDALLFYIKKDDCMPNEINEIRDMFFGLYRNIYNTNVYCFKDIEPLKKLKNGIDDFLNHALNIDKVKITQLKWFSMNLEQFIGCLSKVEE